MTAGEGVERTDLDVRVEAEDRAGVMPDRVEGADVIAHREVLARVDAAGVERAGQVGLVLTGALLARSLAVDVLVEAHDRMAGDEWDPLAYLGSVAAGVVRALRDLGAVAPVSVERLVPGGGLQITDADGDSLTVERAARVRAVVIVRTPEVPERRVSSVILCGNHDGRRCTCGAPADTPNGMHHTYCPVNPASRTGGGS